MAFLVTAGSAWRWSAPLFVICMVGRWKRCSPPGISLMLIQLVRMLFGAERGGGKPGLGSRRAGPAEPDPAVEPAGGTGVRPAGAVLTRSSLNRTRLGMNVRAVTQNRAMAACCGVPTGRVDMLAFGPAPVLPGWAAWRCRSLATSGLNWVRDTSSTRFWWWCWRRRPAGRQRGGGLWAGHFQQNSRTANGRGAGQDPDPVMIILFIQKRPQGLFALKGRVIDQ
ncbi:hypothetical protein J4733_11750 [Klebsiella pneumoniae]|uniref:Uncharacterized protein n=1 Tax=Klebsiella pneumoniae TaxID=573 RepID=A0A939NR16_KLEPN|nr:hypothetical protein [Klebsiella pneumoniae]